MEKLEELKKIILSAIEKGRKPVNTQYVGQGVSQSESVSYSFSASDIHAICLILNITPPGLNCIWDSELGYIQRTPSASSFGGIMYSPKGWPGAGSHAHSITSSR